MSQWADEYGVLTDGTAEPGQWKTLGYQRAIMDAFSRPEVEEVTFIKSARLGWTEIVKHVIGYYIDQDPCSILAVQPAIEDAEGWSKENIQPFIDACDPLNRKVPAPKAKDSKSTITKKHYPGGVLHIIGANSPRGFRRISTRVVLFDEIDGYPSTAGIEGDQLKLGKMRSETFWNRKIGYGSTPTDSGFSRIEQQANKSSLGYCLLRCPHCGNDHIRRFREPDKPIKVQGEILPVSIIQWTDDHKSAAWICPGCASVIQNKFNRKMIEGARWVAEDWEWTNETNFTFFDSFDGHIGFSLWAGYSQSPNSTPVKLVKEWYDVKDNPEKLKTFVNTVLGETWKEPGDTVDPDSLQARAVEYAAEVPAGALVLTAGIDLQADRIELEVVGWDADEQSWNVDYQILFGDITQQLVWDELKTALNARYTHESGKELSIAAAGMDTGYMPSLVYGFAEKFGNRHFYPVKGKDGAIPIIEDRNRRAQRLRKRSQKGHAPEIVGVDEAKTLLYRRLKLQKPGPGYCHFPAERDGEYFLQLTSEILRTKYIRGRAIPYWDKLRPRNEALDNRGYANAALRLLNVNWKALAESFQEKEPEPAKETKPRTTLQKPKPAPRRRKNWATDI